MFKKPIILKTLSIILMFSRILKDYSDPVSHAESVSPLVSVFKLLWV